MNCLSGVLVLVWCTEMMRWTTGVQHVVSVRTVMVYSCLASCHLNCSLKLLSTGITTTDVHQIVLVSTLYVWCWWSGVVMVPCRVNWCRQLFTTAAPCKHGHGQGHHRPHCIIIIFLILSASSFVFILALAMIIIIGQIKLSETHFWSKVCLLHPEKGGKMAGVSKNS